MGLRDTYAYAIQTAKGKFHGNAEERDGKLHWKGTVASEAEKNEIWNAIKTIPTWQKDIVADIQVTGGGAAAERHGELCRQGLRLLHPPAGGDGERRAAHQPLHGGRVGLPRLFHVCLRERRLAGQGTLREVLPLGDPHDRGPGIRTEILVNYQLLALNTSSHLAA